MHADAVVRLAGARFITVIGRGRAGDVLRLTGIGAASTWSATLTALIGEVRRPPIG